MTAAAALSENRAGTAPLHSHKFFGNIKEKIQGKEKKKTEMENTTLAVRVKKPISLIGGRV